jgi:hypothetical protein
MNRHATHFLAAMFALIVAPSAMATPYSDAVLSSNPVSYWTFNESSIGNAAALDSATLGTATSGTFLGASRRSLGLNGLGTSMHPNGSIDGVNVGTADLTHSSFTVEALITTNWNGTGFKEIFRKEDGGNRILLSFQQASAITGGGTGGPVVGSGSNPGIAFGINAGGSYGELDIRFDGLAGRPSLAQLQSGVHHVAATYDQATGVRSVYWNGVLIGSNATAPGVMTSGGGTPAVIGNASTGGGEPFTGQIDELAIYGSALSAATVAAHAALGTAAQKSVSLSSSVLGPGNFGDGYTNNSTVELVRFISNSTADPHNITYTQGAATIDFADYVTSGATAGNLGSNIHGRGSSLFLPGDGETVANNAGGLGIGAHANWLVTFDLDEIRDDFFGGAPGDLQLTGRFGMNGQGSPGETVTAAGEVQGLIYVDGVLVDETTLQSVGEASYLIDLIIQQDGQFLTLAIVNGENGNATTFDDGTFRDLTLTLIAVPEPTTVALWSVATIVLGLMVWNRRRNAVAKALLSA